MKVKDFSFDEVSIYVEKPKLSRLAGKVKRNQKIKHRQALHIVANIMFGMKKDFSEYYEHAAFDLTIHEAFEKHPDLARERSDKIAKLGGIDNQYCERILLSYTKEK